MLGRITRLLEDRGPLPLGEISAALQSDPSAVEGMLASLLRMGRIREVAGPSCGGCSGCGVANTPFYAAARDATSAVSSDTRSCSSSSR